MRMAFPVSLCRQDTFVPAPHLSPSGPHLRQEGHTRLHLIPVRLQSQNLPEAFQGHTRQYRKDRSRWPYKPGQPLHTQYSGFHLIPLPVP